MNNQVREAFEKPEELIFAERLIVENKYSEALQALMRLEQEVNLPLYHKVSCLKLQAQLLMWLGRLEECLKTAEKTYKLSQRLSNSLQKLDPLLLMALVNNWLGNINKSNEIMKEAEDLFNTFTTQSSADYIYRQANLNFIKGYLISLDDANKGLEYLEYSLSLWNKIDPKIGKAMTIMCIGLILYTSKGELDQSIKFLEQALKIAEDINNNFGIAFLLSHLGNSYSFKGEINRALQYYQKSLEIYSEINNKPRIASLNNLIGELMGEKGDFDQALKFVEKSLAIYGEIGPSYARSLFGPLGAAIEISIGKGENGLAINYLNKFKEINEQFKLPVMDLWISYYNSILLKKSPRTRDKAKAEELLKKIIEKSNIERFSLLINALIHLCDLYLTEFRNTNNLEVLDDINPIINRLLDIAKHSHSYLILCETFILQAKLALITLEVKEARKYLTQAQQIAKKYGMKLLAMKISNEHDELLRQLNMWENLKQSNAPIAERVKFTRLGDQIDKMLHKRVEESIELSEDIPVVVLITSKGGTPVFSKSFKKDFSFRDHLWGGFLTAFNSFCGEMLSEGLDRVKFGEYTLIMNSVSPFLVFYLFKGQSYLAQHKMQSFIEKMKNNETIWQTFYNFYERNQEVQLKDIPILDEVLTQTFLTNNILESLK